MNSTPGNPGVTRETKPQICWVPKNVQDPGLTRQRNQCTWRSACFRGDNAAFLHTGRDGNRYFEEDRAVLDAINIAGGNMAVQLIDPYWESSWSPQDAVTGEDDTKMPQLVRNKQLDSKALGFQLRWKRVLGQGGMGIATLWEAQFEDGYREEIVIKLDPRERPADLVQEWNWHRRYQDAGHIVQARDLELMAIEHSSNKDKKAQFLMGEANVSVLEYMSHGPLIDLFTKAACLNLKFPNNALWQLWGCRKSRESLASPLFSLHPSTTTTAN